ncbi:MAG: hypothetical protein RMJ37_07570 [Spirochaetia bacterium]|nr:hypothetical protein [Spirochaetota bacterium]MDW8113172.1 hypothetical protein [Spirochaetia bacterium]
MVKIRIMLSLNVQDVITVIGPLVLFSLSLLSSVGLIIFILIEKKARNFLVIVFLISLFMSGYLVLNFLLGVFGFDTGDPTRISKNKDIIILFSKLEILSLVLGLIMFSNISVVLTNTLFSKIKSVLTLIVGVVILYLNFFSNQFFLEDRLKLSMNEYMAQEGPLFDVFVVYFAVVVLSEFIFLSLYRKKIKPDLMESYKSSIYGMVIIVVFGFLELLELYDLISIYPYVPSLLGLGISVFSTTILVMLVNRHLLILKQNKLVVDLMNSTRNSLSISNLRMLEEIENLSQSFLRMENEIKAIMELPKITQGIISGISESFLKIRDAIYLNTNLLSEFSSGAKLEINSIEMTKLKEMILDISNKTLDIYKRFLNVGDIGIDKLYKVGFADVDLEYISSLPKNLDISQDIVEKLNGYITEVKVMLINISILGAKTITSGSNSSTIISQEMLESVKSLDVPIKKLSNSIEQIHKVVEKMDSLVGSIMLVIQKIKNMDRKDTVDVLRSIDNFINILSDLQSSINNLLNLKDKALTLLSSIDNTTNELKSMVSGVYNFAQETQLMYDQYINLISGIEGVYNNIQSMKRYLEEIGV